MLFAKNGGLLSSTFFYPLSFKTSNYQIFQFPSWSTCFWYPACACTLKNWLEWLILWVLSKLISWWFKPRLNISYGGWVIEFFLLAWGVNGYRPRVESRESNRVMDYNAPPNSWTFGRAQQEFELSLGLSNFIPIYVAYIEECMLTWNLGNFCLKLWHIWSYFITISSWPTIGWKVLHFLLCVRPGCDIFLKFFETFLACCYTSSKWIWISCMYIGPLVGLFPQLN